MKYLNGLIVSIMLISIIGCIESWKYNAYNEFKSEVSSKVFSLFPIKTKEAINSSHAQIIDFPLAISSLGYCGYFIIYKHNLEQFNLAIEDLEHKKKKKYSITDSLNIYIPISDTIIISHSGTNIPVPNLFNE